MKTYEIIAEGKTMGDILWRLTIEGFCQENTAVAILRKNLNAAEFATQQINQRSLHSSENSWLPWEMDMI